MSAHHICCVFALVLLCGGTARAQDIGCWANTKHDFKAHVVRMGTGLQSAPASAIRTSNLKWELPIAATTGVLIAYVDQPAARRAKSAQVAVGSDIASNVVIGAEFGAAMLAYSIGCAKSKPQARSVGFTVLAAMGYAIGTDLALKAAFNREYPDKWNGNGRFWAGGKSFPSGHAAAAFGMASAFATRYPRHRWLRWSAYGVAASVGILRFPARKHFPSDILVGGTLGYVTGRWVGDPH